MPSLQTHVVAVAVVEVVVVVVDRSAIEKKNSHDLFVNVVWDANNIDIYIIILTNFISIYTY